MPDRISFSSSGSGPPLVLVHGLSGSRRWWRHQIPVLEGHYTVWVLELPGFGASSRYRPLEIRPAAELLTDFLKLHGLEGCILIGHSMGAHIALRVAANSESHGLELRGLVLVSASALVTRSVPRLMLDLPRLSLRGNRRFIATVVRDGLRAGLPNLWRAASYVVRDTPLEVLSLVRCQTLLIWGERDTWVTQRMGEQLLAGLPRARLEVLRGAAHVPMVDRAEDFNRVLLAWLEELENETGRTRSSPLR